MATGILGANDLAVTTNTTVYTVPADTFAVVTVNITNRNSQSRNIRIATADDDTPTNAEWIEFDTEILGNGVIERSGIVLNEGKKIVAHTNSTEVNVVVYGIETRTN